MKIQQTERTRREFLTEVGRGMVTATVGFAMAGELGLSSAGASESSDRLEFGRLEPLVRLMQDTPADRLLPALVEKLRGGVALKELVAAAALANARSFGGEDYVGFHTMMALAPGWHMAQELPEEQRPLPVFKVLYRNTSRIQESGANHREVLHPVAPDARPTGPSGGAWLRAAVQSKDPLRAEAAFAALAQPSTEDAFNDLLEVVQDQSDVHRIVLPYRAWDLLGIIGREQAQTLLRQSVRYCVKAENWQGGGPARDPATILPKLLEEHKLLGRQAGNRPADDAWVEKMSQLIFTSTPAQAAAAVAEALAEGMSPTALGEAISLAANQLILRDHGRTPSDEVAGKPIGSVHGDSIGVHACDSANAWRNLARVGNARNVFASLILGAHQASLDRTQRGGDFAHWAPLPLGSHLAGVAGQEPAVLLKELESAVRGNLQARAMAVTQRYLALAHPSRDVFALLLRYAISEDGSLHAEKFYRTNREEYAAARPVFRDRYLVALARVTASEFGRPAAGVAEARTLLGV